MIDHVYSTPCAHDLIGMKRKRKTTSDQGALKRQRIDNVSKESPTCALLRQYYPRVCTLRLYLASRLPKSRRKKVLHYGTKINAVSNTSIDVSLVQLLDSVVVGSFDQAEVSEVESIEQDVTVFTQQLSESSTTITPTQGALKQCEVGYQKCFL